MKTIMLLCAVVAAVALPSRAMALKTSHAAHVSLGSSGSSTNAGEWHITLDQLVDRGDHQACRYFVTWVNTAGLQRSVNLYVEEQTLAGLDDCLDNSTRGFTTTVVNSPGMKSMGFTANQTVQEIKSVVLGQDDRGNLHGVVQFKDGSTSGLTVSP